MSDQVQATARLSVAVPGEAYHRELISCQVACPVHTDARGYIRAIAAGRYEDAYLIARGPNPFASICGRVCGAPCEAACRRGRIPRTDANGCFVANDQPVSIRALKRFACERAGVEARPPDDVLEAVRAFVPDVSGHIEEIAWLLRAAVRKDIVPASGESVAIIGAGPAGLSAAHDLALLGLRPTVYEMEPEPAGMLVYGIPEYRLPRELIRREIAVIEALGVEIRCGVEVGKDVSFAELRERHDAVLMAVGAKRSRSLGIAGEAGPGVFGGVDLLRSVALGQSLAVGQDVVVIGGGSVAYDVARTVVRQAAHDAARTAARLTTTRRVRLVSLESLEEMPAETVEIREGDEEGVERLHGWGPCEIARGDDGRPRGVVFRKCRRVYDEDRRFAPIFDDGDRITLECDTVLLAVGQATDLGFLDVGGQDVEHGAPGWPKSDSESLQTTAERVFVAGDLAHGTRIIIDAVASGKRAARSIYHAITGRRLDHEILQSHLTLGTYARELGYESIERVEVPSLAPDARRADPSATVEVGYDESQARREAERCLDCGVTPVFDGTRCVLCGGCADVCPTLCLKLVPLEELEPNADLDAALEGTIGSATPRSGHSAILKDEDRCIRCALCVTRCPVEAITMERINFTTSWRAQ